MRIIDAIADADALRPNAMDEEFKSRCLMTIEIEFSELTGEDMPDSSDLDAELIMGEPFDQAYVWYLCAMIDNYNQDTGLYANDMEMANAAIDAAKSYYIRQNRPEKKPDGNWKVMPFTDTKPVYDPLDLE